MVIELVLIVLIKVEFNIGVLVIELLVKVNKGLDKILVKDVVRIDKINFICKGCILGSF